MLAKLEAEVEKVRGPYEEPEDARHVWHIFFRLLMIAEMTRCQCDTVQPTMTFKMRSQFSPDLWTNLNDLKTH